MSPQALACSISHRPCELEKVPAMSTEFDRRRFLGATGLAAAVELTPRTADAQTAPTAGGPIVTYQIKPLPFSPSGIPGLSEKILVSHNENNYSGAVKRLNAIGAELAKVDYAKAPVFMINGLKREELIAMNSMILTRHISAALAARAIPAVAWPMPSIAISEASIGGGTEFAAMGRAEGGGSGWVILVYSPRDRRLVNQWAADPQHDDARGRAPDILVLDMYEHAYHMDYGAKAAAYVDVFMKTIHWENAMKQYDRVSGES